MFFRESKIKICFFTLNHLRHIRRKVVILPLIFSGSLINSHLSFVFIRYFLCCADTGFLRTSLNSGLRSERVTMPRGWRSWRGGRSRSMIWPRRSSKEGAAEGGSSLNLSASAADCNTEQVSTGGRCTCPHMQRWLCWIFLLRPAYSNGFIEVTLTDLYRHLGWTQHCPRRPVKELKQHLSCTSVFFQQGAELTAT